MSDFYQVYFALAPQRRLVKIGVTAGPIARRLQSMMFEGKPIKGLRVLYAVPVKEKRHERWFHSQFTVRRHHEHKNCEWFRLRASEIELVIQKYLQQSAAGNVVIAHFHRCLEEEGHTFECSKARCNRSDFYCPVCEKTA